MLGGARVSGGEDGEAKAEGAFVLFFSHFQNRGLKAIEQAETGKESIVRRGTILSW